MFRPDRVRPVRSETVGTSALSKPTVRALVFIEQNIGNTKILVLRSPQHHPVHLDEFTAAEDLPDLLSHVTYDDKLGILLPRTSSKHPYVVCLSSTLAPEEVEFSTAGDGNIGQGRISFPGD